MINNDRLFVLRRQSPRNRVSEELVIIAEIPKEEYIKKCTSACAGCSSSLTLRYVLKAAGPDTVLVVPACCTSVIQGIYPNTAMNVPVYNVAFAAAAACASGMTEAFQAMGKKTHVIVYAGDGGTLDIGIQSMSGAFERGTDFLYICYDNEAYGNTGMQRSGATPLGAKTTTTPTGKTVEKKDIDAIAAAHHLEYMATACSAYPQDIYKESCKGAHVPGPDLYPYPCPLPARLAVPDREDNRDGKTRGEIRHVGALRARARETDDWRTLKSSDEKTAAARRLPRPAGPVQGHRCKVA